MGVSIVLVLVLISFIYNIAKKNRILLNVLMCLVPFGLTWTSILYTFYNTSNGIDIVINISNLASCTCGLILMIVAILLVIKDRKVIRASKSMLLLVMVIVYTCMLLLNQPNYSIFTGISDYYRRLYMINIGIGLLFILQINLFVNLISNNKKLDK